MCGFRAKKKINNLNVFKINIDKYTSNIVLTAVELFSHIDI